MMGEFFRGWRRKFGCFTLLMALWLLGFWLTGLQSPRLAKGAPPTDFIVVPFTVKYMWMIGWCDSHFSIFEMRDLHEDDDMSGNIEPLVAMGYLLGERIDQIYPILGDRFACYDRIVAKYRFRGIVIPNWSTVVSLTLLSAYLLLTRPPKSIQKKLIEPKAVEAS